MYATLEDLRGRISETDLAQLTDPAGEVVQADAALQALADASAEIDGYLAGRYTLPLPSPPAILVGMACDIAQYRLMRLRPSGDMEDARKRYEDARDYLLRVAKGQVLLAPADPAAPDHARLQVETAGRGRTFDRDTMRGF